MEHAKKKGQLDYLIWPFHSYHLRITSASLYKDTGTKHSTSTNNNYIVFCICLRVFTKIVQRRWLQRLRRQSHQNLSTLFEIGDLTVLSGKIMYVKQRISFKLDSRLLLWRLYILIGALFLCFCLIHLFGKPGDRMLVDMGNNCNCFTLCSHRLPVATTAVHLRFVSSHYAQAGCIFYTNHISDRFHYFTTYLASECINSIPLLTLIFQHVGWVMTRYDT